MFRTIAEAKGEGLDPVKHVYAPSDLLLTSAVVLSFPCLLYVSNMATAIASCFASCYILNEINRKSVKNSCLMFFLVYLVDYNCYRWLETLQKQRVRFGSINTCLSPLPPHSKLLLTVPRRYFCCGSSMLHVTSVCIWSSAIWSVE